jgi:hypothetical protein
MCDGCRGGLMSGTLDPAREPRRLLVLSRDVPPVAGHLALPVRAYLEPTTVVWDRRQADRRRRPQPGAPERRRHDRRGVAVSPWTWGVMVRPAPTQSAGGPDDVSVSA